jgi:O-acetyl-ADP-ribose deacetylase (regulator of RNase III)
MRRIIEALPCSIVDTGADAVVNASNPDAVLGGGVSRALFNECGGDVLQREMREKLEAEFDGELSPEDCLVTSGGTSKRIRFVLHVPSVDYRDPRTSTNERVSSAAEAALRSAAATAETAGPLAVAFPLLGAGSGGLSPGVSLKAMVDGLRRFFKEEPQAPIARVVFAVPEPDRFELAKQRLDQLLVLR